ncbi:hypothetical protein TSMEX_004314 [Taenia solium]|eukprot:TsM_000296900 transcript=TsM_000296900 gene=TsM_000296900
MARMPVLPDWGGDEFGLATQVRDIESCDLEHAREVEEEAGEAIEAKKEEDETEEQVNCAFNWLEIVGHALL